MITRRFQNNGLSSALLAALPKLGKDSWTQQRTHLWRQPVNAHQVLRQVREVNIPLQVPEHRAVHLHPLHVLLVQLRSTGGHTQEVC